MQKCPTCEYRTANPKQMAKHVEKTRHGMLKGSREDRSYLKTPRKKKR